MVRPWPFGLPALRHGLPDEGPGRDALLLGALSMYLTVFLALVGQGSSPQQALAITAALAVGSVEFARLVRRDDHDGHGDCGDHRGDAR